MTASPTLGEAFDPLGAQRDDPWAFYERARREEPVFFAPRFNAWVVTRYRDVREALRKSEVFSSANALRPVIPLTPAAIAEIQHGYPIAQHAINSDGPAHRHHRAPLNASLSPERVRAAEPFIRQRAEELLDAVADAGHADLMAALAYPLPVDVISHLGDIRAEDRGAARDGSYQSARLLFFQNDEDAQAQAARGHVAFQHLIARYVQQRHAAPGDGDFISQTVTALVPDRDQPLTREQETQLVSSVQGTILAGHTTTSALLGNGLHRLLSDRARWEELCAQPDRIPAAVQELARLDTPTHAFFRVTTQPVSLGGADLPAGAEVLLVYASANRDADEFDHPDEIDLSRSPVRHLAFAQGAHYCPGAGLARTEVEIALELLTRRLPTLRLSPDHPVEFRPTLTIRGPETLHVTW